MVQQILSSSLFYFPDVQAALTQSRPNIYLASQNSMEQDPGISVRDLQYISNLRFYIKKIQLRYVRHAIV